MTARPSAADPAPTDPADPVVARAREVLAEADALLVATGAGMGVDSGLPDFRGNEGFWKAYPPFARLGLSFAELANPQWFERDPTLAWGFYGHRLHLYRDTRPHPGYDILRDFGNRMSLPAFAFTSNVDGHFQRAGWDPDRVCEVHGSIHHLQCTRARCDAGIWSADGVTVAVDPETLRAAEPWPRCRSCGALARPNILMFGDYGWRPARSDAQEERLAGWLAAVGDRRLAIVELGAGTAVATVRSLTERLHRTRHPSGRATLVRVNPREPDGPPGTLGIAGPALATLRELLPQESGRRRL